MSIVSSSPKLGNLIRICDLFWEMMLNAGFSSNGVRVGVESKS